MAEQQREFEYKTINVGSIGLQLADPHDIIVNRRLVHEHGHIAHAGKIVKAVLIDDEPITPSGRFWTSLYSRFGLNASFFKFFTHLEIFQRLSDRAKDADIRVCIERNKDTGSSKLLAVSGTKKPLVIYDELIDTLKQFNSTPSGIRYHNGVVISTHTPTIGQSEFKIGADKFQNQYEVHVPIDGFGKPNIYLAMLRYICSNGMVGFANTFKTSLSIGTSGDSIQYILRRALESFANDEGYAVLRNRFETAMNSWASIREYFMLYRTLLRIQSDPLLQNVDEDRLLPNVSKEDYEVSVTQALMKSYENITGNPYENYRQDPNMMSDKRQRNLPVECRVYEMINFATEIATHHVSESSARQLQAWVGETLSNDYDLEDSCDTFNDWRDLYVTTELQETKEQYHDKSRDT